MLKFSLEDLGINGTCGLTRQEDPGDAVMYEDALLLANRYVLGVIQVFKTPASVHRPAESWTCCPAFSAILERTARSAAGIAEQLIMLDSLKTISPGGTCRLWTPDAALCVSS
jgi:hypothetical protein